MRKIKRFICLLLAFLCLFSAACAGEPEIMEGSKEDTPQGSVRSYADLAVTDEGNLWQVTDGAVRCSEIRSQRAIAVMPLTDLYAEDEDDLYLSAYGDSAWLCVIHEAGSSACRIMLYELALDNEAVVLRRSIDASGKLGFLADGGTAWQETEIKACAQGIYVGTMDQDQIIHMELYQPEGDRLISLGIQDFRFFSGIFAFGKDLLLCGTDEIRRDTENLIRIGLPSGERTVIGSFVTDPMNYPVCLAFSEKEQVLYYVLNGTGYRIGIGSESQAEPFCSIPDTMVPMRYGAVGAERYLLPDTSGELIERETAASMQAEPFRILDLTGAETLSGTVSIFNETDGRNLLILSSGDEESDVLDAVLSQSGDYDAFAVRLGSNLYKTLRNRGYLGTFEGSETLTAAAASTPERIRSQVTDGGRLIAFPVYVANAVVTLNIPAVTELTGIPKEEIPTDWPGFLRLLGKIAEQGLPEDGRYMLYEEGISGKTLKSLFFSWMMEDLMIWLAEDESRIGSLQETVLPVLQAFSDVQWEAFGQEESSWMDEEEEKTSLVLMTEPEIAVMALDPGMEYWPLSIEENGERKAGQEVDVLILNPYARHPDAVVRYAETVWEQMDAVIRMELDPNRNETVVNDSFEEDMAFWSQMIQLYQQAIEEAESEQEAAKLRAEMAELSAFAERYRENAGWIVSEDSIALYRSLEPRFALSADAFWSEAAEDAAVFQFLDGMMPAAQFAQQLSSAILMSRLEEE